MKLFSTSCETEFLGWDAPLLPRAVDAIVRRYAEGDGDVWDLSSLLCVLPTGRSVRRFEGLLADRAAASGKRYRSPWIITVGQLAEHLYEPSAPVALEFEQTLAWAHVLRETSPDELRAIMATVPPPEPIGPWLELAGILRRLHQELSASRLTFHDVIERAETETEVGRWELLAGVFDRYRDSLVQAGLLDPHVGRATAIAENSCRTDRVVVLVGTSDISDMLVAMLRSLTTEMMALVAAPQSQAARFDEFGCVKTDRWMDHQLPIEDHQLIAAGDIADQSAAVAESVSELATDYFPEEVTVGVTDESQVGPIEIELRGCGVSTFRQLGWTVAETAIGSLLNKTAAHLNRQTWASLATLVRHADFCDWVTQALNERLASPSTPSSGKPKSKLTLPIDSTTWLTQLDRLLSDHYPVRVDKPLPPAALEAWPLAVLVGELVTENLEPLAGQNQSIASWSAAVGTWMAQLYGVPFDINTSPAEMMTDQSDQPHAPESAVVSSRTGLALDAALGFIGRFASLNDRLDLLVDGAAAIEMLAQRSSDIRVLERPAADQVAIVGWLDLALDDAPSMTVLGLNHPFVPGATTSDPFLPGSLRTKLRMEDNGRRYVRDVYAMHLMLSTRKDVRFIVGKFAADRSPTPPSRLLAAAPTEDAARRIRMLLGRQRPRRIVEHQWDAQSSAPESRRSIPIPQLDLSGSGELVKTMSVTAFRDYLACPYRFYLRHVLKLKPLDDATSELAANQFGDLVHGAVERYGLSGDRDQSEPAKIEKALLNHLHQYAEHVYGSDASTAVGLQITQAERRLKAVAVAQAARFAGGWRIHATEASVNERDGAAIKLDGKTMGLRGRFDRIDHHPATGRWAILDYKTHGHTPEKKHLQKTDDGYQWIDLQLPLYRMMIPFLGIDAPADQVELGYFNVSEKDEETKINIATFTESQMAEAEAIIHDCVRKIWQRQFDPTDDRVAFDDFAMILQTGVASQLLDQAETMESAEVSS